MTNARELSNRLAELLRQEHHAFADFLVALADFDRRRLWRDLGYVSLFSKRKGLVEKPRREPPPAKPDHVPAHVKRAVWKRDGGRCQWPVQGGGICGSTHQVELDHVRPRGRGGPPTVENTRCLCKFHNQLAARQVCGDAWMDRFTRRGTAGEPVAVWSASPRRSERWSLEAVRARLDGG